MKFKLSTLIWITTLTAVIIAGYAIVQSERRKSEEAGLRAAAVSEEATTARNEAVEKLREVERKYESVERTAKVFKSLHENSEPRLLYLGPSLSWTRDYSSSQLCTDWNWRVFLPKDHPKVEYCWAVDGIPKSGFPLESKTFKTDLVVGQPHESADGKKKWNVWLGTTVFSCRLEPVGEDHLYCRTSSNPHEIDAAPFSTQFSKGHGWHVQANDMDWLTSSWLGSTDSTESVEVDDLGSRDISYEKPHVLVRIRGRKKEGDDFSNVDGPVPGFMLWLRKKVEATNDSE